MNPTNPKPLQLRTALPPKKNPKNPGRGPSWPGPAPDEPPAWPRSEALPGVRGGGGFGPQNFWKFWWLRAFFQDVLSLPPSKDEFRVFGVQGL